MVNQKYVCMTLYNLFVLTRVTVDALPPLRIYEDVVFLAEFQSGFCYISTVSVVDYDIRRKMFVDIITTDLFVILL